jgi:hypothetical protein
MCRELLIDVQDYLHSIYINGGRQELTDAKARRLMRESAAEGIEFIDNALDDPLVPKED